MSAMQQSRFSGGPLGRIASFGRIGFHLVGILGAVLLSLGALAARGGVWPPQDDAFILLVYVRHLVDHGAIYWNVEEGRVDGCTSMLDVLTKALVYLVTRSTDLLRMNWLVTVGTMVFFACMAVVVLGELARRSRSNWSFAIAFVAALALAGNRAAADGAMFLLETPLYLVVLLLGVAMLLFIERWTVGWGVAFGVECLLLLLARPEALSLAIVLLAYLAYFRRQEGAWMPDRPAFVTVCVAALLIAAYLLWHRLYFGYWAPNTYYAKKSESRLSELNDGIEYLQLNARSLWGKVAILSTVLAPLLVFAKTWTGRAQRRLFSLVSGLGLFNLVIIVVAGGDCYFERARFLASPTILATLALAFAAMNTRKLSRVIAFTPVLLLAWGNVSLVRANMPSKYVLAKENWPISSKLVPMQWDADAAKKLAELGVSFAQTDQQWMKFFADDIRVIDASALSDTLAAHTPEFGRVTWGKGGVAHALRRNAESFSYGFKNPCSPEAMATYSAREVIYDDEIRARFLGAIFGHLIPERDGAGDLYRNFRPASLRACGQWFNFWLRNDVADRLQGRPDLLIGRQDPERMIPLGEPSSIAFEGFGAPEAGLGTTIRRATVSGVVRLGKEAFGEGEHTFPCALGVMSGAGAGPFAVSLDGEELAPIDHLHRFQLPSWVSDRAGDNGPRELRIRSVTPNPNIILTGLFLTDCGTSRLP